MAPIVSDSVTGRRLASASVTGWPENQERPMSPVRALPAQSKNWHDDRPVEAELLRLAGHDRRVCGVADDAPSGVARAEVEEIEAEHADREHGEHACPQAAEDEGQH